MKLVNVIAVRESWGHLTSLRIPPTPAYWLMKYTHKIQDDLSVIEKKRIQLVLECAGAKEGDRVTLEAGTEPHAKFISEFNEFLQTESKLKPLEMDMDALIVALNLRLIQLQATISLLNARIDQEKDEKKQLGLFHQRDSLEEQLNMISPDDLLLLEPFFASCKEPANETAEKPEGD